MAKYVLAADYTLMTDYRNVPLATFFSCIPTDYWQSRLVFRILADQPKLDAQGRPIRVPYGLRKVEASLVRAFGREDVVIADPRDVDRYIDDETEVVGLHSMDPLGLGPVSMSFTMGGVLTPYTKAMFLELVKRVQRPNRKYKVVLGGPGAWHFDYRQEMQESLGIDHIVHGEVDHLVPEIFDRIVNDSAPPVMRFTNATAPPRTRRAGGAARRSRASGASGTARKSCTRVRTRGLASRAGSRPGARRSPGPCCTGRLLPSRLKSGPTSSWKAPRS